MRIGVALALALISTGAEARRHVAPTLPIGQSASYRCVDRQSIELLFAGDGSALLTAGGATATLKPTDTTGAHFQGGGWRWSSSTATAGVLARVGAAGRATQGVACTVG